MVELDRDRRRAAVVRRADDRAFARPVAGLRRGYQRRMVRGRTGTRALCRGPGSRLRRPSTSGGEGGLRPHVETRCHRPGVVGGGLDHLAFSVPDGDALHAWADHLTEIGIEHQRGSRWRTGTLHFSSATPTGSPSSWWPRSPPEPSPVAGRAVVGSGAGLHVPGRPRPALYTPHRYVQPGSGVAPRRELCRLTACSSTPPVHRTVATGESIYREGDVGSHMFGIVSGEVTLLQGIGGGGHARTQ